MFLVLTIESKSFIFAPVVFQYVLFEYPSTFKSTYVRQVIRWEIGTLIEWSPSEILGINSDVLKIYPILFEGDKIEVKAVLPERTF